MAQTVFWSWQSDQPSRETRSLIRDALIAALDRIAVDLEEADRPEIDHDTKDMPGSPDIVASILAKIEAAAVFIADPNVVIGAKLKPIPDGQGGIEMEQVGHTTVDFQQIGDRARDFGIAIDHSALRSLNKIRNDMEHHYTSESAAAIRAAISKGFPVVASLFRQLDEDPLALLGNAWTVMLETKDLYDQELQAARKTLAGVAWHSPSVAGAGLRCPSCQSELIEQVDGDNEAQDDIEFRCRTCGAKPEAGDVIEQALDDLYASSAYVRYKDAMEDGPLYQCPACDRHTLVEGEDCCANCSEPLDYRSECIRCGTGIGIQDYLDGLDEGLCSYCAYVAEKVMRED